MLFSQKGFVTLGLKAAGVGKGVWRGVGRAWEGLGRTWGRVGEAWLSIVLKPFCLNYQILHLQHQ